MSMVNFSLAPGGTLRLSAAGAGFAGDVDWTRTLAVLGALAAVLVAIGVAVGVALGRSLGSRRAPRSDDAPAVDSGLTACDIGLNNQRAALIGGCLKVRRLLDDPLLADVLDDALREAGVAVFDPTGQRRDPSRHRVDHTVPATDPARDGLIAQTLIPGYLDDGRVLQPAEVVVYKWERR